MKGAIMDGMVMNGASIKGVVMNEALWFEVLLKLSVLHFSLVYC